MVILPLYPQYAAATTATVCDEVYRTLMKMRWQPSLQVIPHYESEPLYIKAIAVSIKKVLRIKLSGRQMLLWHHITGYQKYFDKGDPYHCYCHKTTRLLVEHMKIDIPILTTFQSRFGPDEWLKPYTDETIDNLPNEGKKENSCNMSRICIRLC